MRIRSWITAALALVLGLSVTQSGRAGVIFVTPPGSTTGGGSVSASVDITANNGSITILLTNLTQNPGNAAQLLSAVIFDASGVSGALSTVNSGLVTTITGGSGNYTTGVADPLTRWQASRSGSTVTVTTLSGGNPDRLIIGPDSLGNLNPAGGGKYNNANNSVINDNPSVLGTATFNVTAPGVTTSSVISNVVFQFGTTSGSNQVNGQLSAIPEPSAIALMGISLGSMGLVGVLRRRKARRKAA